MAVHPGRDNDVERWRQVEDLYDAALSCAPDARDAFIAERCSDSDLRGDVISLLRANDEAGRFLTSVPLAMRLQEMSRDTTPPLGGRTLGPYLIGSSIGAGATGDIYRARDSRLGREVALKVLRPRFTQELPVTV